MMNFLSVILAIFPLLIALSLSVASYIMTSYSFYTLAKRRNIKNPWLAWIPEAQYWTLGCLANAYDCKNGYDRKWQTVLITLRIIIWAVTLLAMGILLILMLRMNMLYGTVDDFSMTSGIEDVALALYTILLAVAFVVNLLWAFMNAICVYKVFESTVPDRALRYILLYFLVPFAAPVCLVKCKDKGYSCDPVIYMEL